MSVSAATADPLLFVREASFFGSEVADFSFQVSSCSCRIVEIPMSNLRPRNIKPVTT
jgi:hypothetical protein